MKSLVKEKNNSNLHTITDYSSYQDKRLDSKSHKRGEFNHEKIYQAFRKISTKENKT